MKSTRLRDANQQFWTGAEVGKLRVHRGEQRQIVSSKFLHIEEESYALGGVHQRYEESTNQDPRREIVMNKALSREC